MISFCVFNYCGFADPDYKKSIEKNIKDEDYVRFIEELCNYEHEFDMFETSNTSIKLVVDHINSCFDKFATNYNARSDKFTYVWLDEIYKIMITGFKTYEFLDYPPPELLRAIGSHMESYFLEMYVNDVCEDIDLSTYYDPENGGPELMIAIVIDIIPKERPSFVFKISE